MQVVEALSTYTVDGLLPTGKADDCFNDILVVGENYAAMSHADITVCHPDVYGAMLGAVEKLTDARTCIKLMMACMERPQVR